MTTSHRQSRVRARRESSKGQVMPIFALVVVVLFAATGLAVDAGMAFLTYNGAERAAAAAALAGVPYMPSGLPTGTTGSSPDTTCTGTAAAAACAATARDGLANGEHSQRSHGLCEGDALPVHLRRHRVQPLRGQQADGAGDRVRTADLPARPRLHRSPRDGERHRVLPAADLARPAGRPAGQHADHLGASGNYYFLRSEGYGNPRSEGDAYDPYNKNANISCGQRGHDQPGGHGRLHRRRTPWPPTEPRHRRL